MKNFRFWYHIAPCALLLGLLAFIPGLHGPFLLDDSANLQKAIRAQDTWLSWYQAILGNESGLLRRPLSNLSFLLNAHYFGPHAFSFKVVNLALHGIAGLLVFAFVARLLRLLQPDWAQATQRSLALGAAATWLLHPIQVSTTLYVVQRMTQLSAIGTLAALCVALGFLARRDTKTKDGIKALLLTGGFALVGLMGKENAALTPLLLLAIIACIPKEAAAGFKQNTGKKLFLWLGVYGPSLLLLTLALLYLPQASESYAARQFTMTERLLTQPFILGHYLSTIFVPDIRNMGLYLDGLPVRPADAWASWVGPFLALTAMALAFGLRHKVPLVAFATLWYLACHAMESTVLPLELAFEHRNYLALVGPALLLSHGVMALARVLSPVLHWLVIVSCLAFLATTTTIRAHQWGDVERFIRSEVAHHPTSLRALNSVASLDFELGKLDAAIAWTLQLEELYPNSFWANALRLNIMACRPNTGEPEFENLLRIARNNPHDRQIGLGLITVLTNIVRGGCDNLDPRQIDEFVGNLSTIAQHPEDVERLHLLRAMLAGHEERMDDHLQHLRQAAASNPNGVESRILLAYYHLNHEQPDIAAKYASELHTLIGYGPERHRLAEIEGFIAQEISEMRLNE